MANDRPLDGTLRLDFPSCLAEDFPHELPVAQAAVERILAVLSQSYAALEQHSPALKENDWPNYLRCSIARMVHAAGALRRAGVRAGRLLDYGSYFGNFSGMFAELGFSVDAVDAYGIYANDLAGPIEILRDRGIRVLDFDGVGRDLASLPGSSYDVVLCAGVIEHMPHTPLGLLTSLNRVLKPGGYLLLDTPNVSSLYKRQAMARGESVWPPLAAQFYSPVPYEGHHREYTAPEMAWMLHEVGHQLIAVELYNYSVYGQPALQGRDVTNFWKTQADPTLREYITTLSRYSVGSALGDAPDWRTALMETECVWQAGRPTDIGPHDADLVDVEPLLAQLQREVAVRDQLLRDLQAERNSAVEARDRQLSALRAEHARQIATRDRMLAQQLDERTQAVETRDRLLAKVREECVREAEVRDRIIAAGNQRIDQLQRALDAKWSEVVRRQYRRFSKRKD